MTAQATQHSMDTPDRGAGTTLIVCGIASVVLLLAHPGGASSMVLADVLKAEAAQALPDAIVHGGFVLVLAVSLACFSALALKLGASRIAVLAAMSFALFGAGLLAASMIVDGLITPAVAVRYAAAAADKQEAARGLFVLIGAGLRILMPMGLAFQGAAALAWAAALVPTPGRRRIVGLIGAALGAAMLVAAAMSPGATGPYPLLAALMAFAGWLAAAGVLLSARRPGIASG